MEMSVARKTIHVARTSIRDAAQENPGKRAEMLGPSQSLRAGCSLVRAFLRNQSATVKHLSSEIFLQQVEPIAVAFFGLDMALPASSLTAY
jgi:hypothetical protein